MADQKTMPPEIFITPGEDAYTIDVVGEGEVHLYLKSQDLVTQDWSTEEEVQTHYTIPRTNKPQPIQLRAFAQASGKAKSLDATDGLIIPRTGVEIPAAPEITFTLEPSYCEVHAIGDGGETYLFKKEPSGLWGEPNEDGFMLVYCEEEEVPLLFKAYSTALDYWSYYDEENEEEHYFSYDVRGYETRNDYLLPPDKSHPHGEIVFGTPTNDGKLSITYTGKEDVTIIVMLNDNPVEFIDGVIQLLPGSNDVYVTVSAEGYLEPIHGWMSYYWHVTTPKPQIIVTPGELEYTIEAIGEGEIHLYCEHYCEYHTFEGEMQNPFTIPRINYDETIQCHATASLGQGYETSYAQLDVMVPALAQTPEPQIVFTEDETGCEVRAVGQGEVHLYNCRHEEVENPYRILRPYVPDHEGSYYSNPYFLFYATAKAEGQWESEMVEKKIEITTTPWIDTDKTQPMVYIEELRDENLFDYIVNAGGDGDVRLYMNGVEVENPYTVHTLQIEETCVFTAKAKQEGKLTAYSEPLEIAPGPKREHLVTITSDDDYYYVTATGNGYITLYVYNDFYDSYLDEGEGSATVAIPRQGLMEWTFVAKRYKGPGEDLLGYDLGNFMVILKEFTTNGPSIFEWPSNYQYKIVAMPHFIFDFDYGNHVQLQYSTQLMLDGVIVEEPYYVNRLEHDKYYNFSAVTTLQYERYEFLGTIDGVRTYSAEPLETVQVFSDLVKKTVNVRAGGDNFYYDYEDYEWNPQTGNHDLLRYEIYVKEDPSHDGYWKPHHATVQANSTYTGLATVPDKIMLDYDDMHDGEPMYRYYGDEFGVGELMELSWPGSSDWGQDGGISFYHEPCPVTAIADNAFIGNQSLTGIEIGMNVQSIGKDAFKGCPNLTRVTCWAENPPTMTNVETFDNSCYSNVTLQVPQSSIEKYKNADWWSKFQHINGIETAHAHGDVNGDNEVNVVDVNVVIDAILRGHVGANYDVDGDGEIDIADVIALIDIILTAP